MNIKNIVATGAMLAGMVAAATAQETGRPDLRTFTYRLPLEVKVVKSAPYSADLFTENVQPLSDGNRIVQSSTGRVYRDSDGRVRREEGPTNGAAAVSITDPIANTSYSLDPVAHVAWQMPALPGVRIFRSFEAGSQGSVPPPLAGPMPGAPFGPMPLLGPMPLPKGDVLMLSGRAGFGDAGAAAGSLSQQELPERLIEGIRAQGKRRTTTIPAGAIGNEQPIAIVSEEWFSPELQVLVMTDHSDPRFGTSTYRLTNIVRAEPDHALFEVPPDYTLQKADAIWKQALPRKER